MKNEDEFIGRVGAMLYELALMLAYAPSAQKVSEQLRRHSGRRLRVEVRTRSNHLCLEVETQAATPSQQQNSREPEKPLARTGRNQWTKPAKKSPRMPAAKRRLPGNKQNSN